MCRSVSSYGAKPPSFRAWVKHKQRCAEAIAEAVKPENQFPVYPAVPEHVRRAFAFKVGGYFFLTIGLIIGFVGGSYLLLHWEAMREHIGTFALIALPALIPAGFSWLLLTASKAEKRKGEIPQEARQEDGKEQHVISTINTANPPAWLAKDAAFRVSASLAGALVCLALAWAELAGMIPASFGGHVGRYYWAFPLCIVFAIIGIRFTRIHDRFIKPQILKSINGMEFHPKMQDGSAAHITLQIQLIESEWTQHFSDRLHSDLTAFFAGWFAGIAALPDFQTVEQQILPTLETVYTELGLNLLRHKVLAIEQDQRKKAATATDEPGILF